MLEPEDIAEMIGIPVESWPGNCYAIATQMVATDIIEGRAVHGHWLGDVAPDSMFYRRFTDAGIVPHGWIEDFSVGMIVDPTRWVFEAVEPYIFEGDDEFYDEGGDELRSMMEGQAPLWTPDDEHERYSLQGLPESIIVALGRPPDVTTAQTFWLANLSRVSLGEDIEAVYHWLIEHDREALIPIDNRRKILGD